MYAGKRRQAFFFSPLHLSRKWKGVNFAVSPPPYSIRLTQKPPPLHFTRHHTLLSLREGKKKEQTNLELFLFLFSSSLSADTSGWTCRAQNTDVCCFLFLSVQTWLWDENENEKLKREVAINPLDCSCKNRSHRTTPSQAKVAASTCKGYQYPRFVPLPRSLQRQGEFS